MIVPVGNGTLLLGIARGFAELFQAGLVRREPALIAVQSERCAPLARAWSEGSDEPAEVTAGQTAAEGIAIPHPARGAQILAAVRHTGGCVVAVPEEAIAPAQAVLGRRGLFVEPTAALVWAAALMTQRHPAPRVSRRRSGLGRGPFARVGQRRRAAVRLRSEVRLVGFATLEPRRRPLGQTLRGAGRVREE